MAIKTILVVDDSKTEQAYLSSILKPEGYQIFTADNADETLAFLNNQQPDLILMDVVMPGMNGFQLTRLIKKEEKYKDIPIILCTSKDQPTDRFWGLRQGAVGYLTKPIQAESLFAEIRAIKK